MHVKASPLERWFTTHPGPYRHFLAGAGPAAWGSDTLASWVPPGGPAIDWGYEAPEGSPSLRAAVAAAEGLPDASHAVLTLGASEANFLALFATLRAGDEVVVQVPSYPQLACLAAATGASVVPWPVPADGGCAVDVTSLRGLLTARTRMVVLNAPHNPTGRTLGADEWRLLALAVRSHPRAVLLVDEVYRGVGPAEPLPGVIASVGLERVLVTGSVSKAWGLPGARLGWLLGEPERLAEVVVWREHVGLALATPATAWVEALWPRRAAMEAANRSLVGANSAVLGAWARRWPCLYVRTSDRSAACLVGLEGRPGLDDVAVAEALYAVERLLVVPGSTLGHPGWLRVGYGHRDSGALERALEVLGAALAAA
jgi:aspartate/methionine/tyrosine aminotransferase